MLLVAVDKGIYNGKQIVSSKWIEEMTKPYHKCGEEFRTMSLIPVKMWIPSVEYLNSPVNPDLPPRKSKAEIVQSYCFTDRINHVYRIFLDVL